MAGVDGYLEKGKDAAGWTGAARRGKDGQNGGDGWMQAADILVMGATGKVGRLMRAQWQGTGLRALWQGRSAATGPGWVAWEPGQPLPPVRVVLVLSGVTSGDAAALAMNRRIGLEVAEAAVAAGVGCVLMASTMAVYGRTPPQGAAEGAAPDRPNAYGSAKLEAEQALAARLQGSNTAACALRLGNVAGADMLGTVVAQGRRVALDQFPDGTGPVRSYVGPGMLARVVAALTRRVLDGRRLPPVLNVAGQSPVAMADILTAAGLPFDWQPAGPQAVQRVAMDCTRLAGLVPPRPEQETAAALAAEWREAARP